MKCQESPSGFGCIAHPFRRNPMDDFAVVGGFVSATHTGGGVLEWAESMEIAKDRAELLSECEFTVEVGPYAMSDL